VKKFMRPLASKSSFISAQARAGEELDINWSSLTKLGDETLDRQNPVGAVHTRTQIMKVA
jgi:hypothetical protein